MKKNYIYKLKHRYAKKPELLLEYGFNAYKSEGDEETIYAKGIKLSEDCSIVKYLIGAFEKCHKYAKTEEEKAEFNDYSFYKNGKLRITKKVKDEFTRCQICVVDKGTGKHCLFINAPDRVEYYGVDVLNECCGDLVERLLKDKVIQKIYIKQEDEKEDEEEIR